MYKQIICLVLGYISTALVVTTTVWPTWAWCSPDSASVLGPITAWKGIWADCVSIMGGQYYCEEEASLLLTDAYLITIRAMMCTGICLSGFACVLMLVGIECTRIIEEKPKWKRKIMFLCSILFFVTGVLTLTSLAWYTALLVEDFYSYQTQDNLIKYELGPALFLGYINCFVLICAGLSSCCWAGSKIDGFDDYHSGAANPPTYTLEKRQHFDHKRSVNQMHYV